MVLYFWEKQSLLATFRTNKTAAFSFNHYIMICNNMFIKCCDPFQCFLGFFVVFFKCFFSNCNVCVLVCLLLLCLFVCFCLIVCFCYLFFYIFLCACPFSRSIPLIFLLIRLFTSTNKMPRRSPGAFLP